MSRTYRKKREYSPKSHFWFDWPLDEEATAKDLALAKSDKCYKSEWEQFCFKQVHKVRRASEREELSKVFKIEDYEDYFFDPSRSEKKRKSVWWEIY